MADDTQDAILEGAFRAMVDFGYDKATTKRIAEYAGVNEVTIFRKFGNKAALMQEVIRREAETFQAHIHYTGDLEADLLDLVTSYQGLVQRRGRFMPVLLGEVIRRPELYHLSQKPIQAFGMVLQLVTRYQAEGKLKAEPPFSALFALLGPVLMQTLANLFLPGMVPALDPQQHIASYLDGHRADRRTHERD